MLMDYAKQLSGVLRKSPKKGSCFGKGKYNKRCTTGGLLTSLLLTLVVVPVAYDLFDELQAKVMKRKTKDEG